MDLDVLHADLAWPMTAVFPEPDDYVRHACPICRRTDRMLALAEVWAGTETSLESAFCARCEHRYFQKMPSAAWFQRYYAAEWDGGNSGASRKAEVAFLRRALRRVPFLRRAWQGLLWRRRDVRVRQMFPFLLGVAEGDGEYFLPQPDVRTVLEVGCGYGRLLAEFKKRGFAAVGTEASEHRVAECRRRGLDVVLCPIDGFTPVESRAPFDLAYSTHVLEHTVDPARHLRQMAALLRDGGYLYLQVPNLAGGETLVNQAHTPVHCHTFSARSLSLLLESEGFQVARMQLDNNLHVLARKMKEPGSLVIPAASVRVDDLTEAFRVVEGRTGRRFRLAFDHAYVTLSSVEDGAVLYDRRLAVNVARFPPHAIEFRVRKHPGGDDLLPIRFHHPGERPPVWIKNN